MRIEEQLWPRVAGWEDRVHFGLYVVLLNGSESLLGRTNHSSFMKKYEHPRRTIHASEIFPEKISSRSNEISPLIFVCLFKR